MNKSENIINNIDQLLEDTNPPTGIPKIDPPIASIDKMNPKVKSPLSAYKDTLPSASKPTNNVVNASTPAAISNSINNSDYETETGDDTVAESEAAKRIPPDAVASAAKHGLDLRKKHGRGGTGVGVRMANKLASKSNISDTDIKRIKSYHARHAVDKQGKDWDNNSAGFIASKLWGHTAGKNWANSEVSKLEK